MSDASLQDFMTGWTDDPVGAKPLFESLHARLQSLGARCKYKYRPGVSFSVRGSHPDGKRELFVLVDVIDDDPEARWLSVCFFADLVDDPEERGDVVPAGLMGQDARCFDVDAVDSALTSYLQKRLNHAFAGAASA